MVPQKLEDWTLEAVRTLLTARYMEHESFDYKERLPDARNDSDKRGLRKDCCAFANSSGGFLVFGVHDDVAREVDDRLVGLDARYDFPVHFGNFPSECNPSVRWDFRNPPIALPSGKLIHVVWFPRSWNAPHSIGDPEKGLVFPKRTNRGTEHMSYEEVRMTFLGYYERRIKLQILYSELMNLRNDARDMILPEENWPQTVSLVTLRMDTIESVLVDTFILVRESLPLMMTLTNIRSHARNINNRAAIIHPIMHFPLSNKEELLREHNKWTQQQCTLLGNEAEGASKIIERLLAKG